MKFKRSSIMALGACALVTTVPLLTKTPALATLQQAGNAIVQALKGPQVRLNLSVDKQTIQVNEEGQEQIVWVDLGTQATVMPGDTLRYSIQSENLGDKPAEDLVVTQPIAPQMVYVLGSATTSNEATITYSIDGGETFVMNPTVLVTLEDGTVEERPAPPDAYTHVRWEFSEELAPEVDAEPTVSYEVTVR